LTRPFAVDDPSTNDGLLAFNDAIAQGVSKYNVKLADAFPPFNLAKREHSRERCRLPGDRQPHVGPLRLQVAVI
jgi:hypothetical protein